MTRLVLAAFILKIPQQFSSSMCKNQGISFGEKVTFKSLDVVPGILLQTLHNIHISKKQKKSSLFIESGKNISD